jgi:hypothetical protein
MNNKKSLTVRDQAVSAFSGTLMQLCDATSAFGAAFVDAEGETVDYAGYLDPFETRLFAAEWRLVLQAANQANSTSGAVTCLLCRANNKSYAVYALSDGYALVIQSAHRSLLPSARAVGEALHSLAAEAGLDVDDNSEFRHQHWYRVEVRLDPDKRRPTDLWYGGEWMPLEIVGRYINFVELSRRTTGFRARLQDGSDLTLVREPLERWYADVLPQVSSLPTRFGSR